MCFDHDNHYTYSLARCREGYTFTNAKRLASSIIHSGSEEEEFELKPKCNSFYCQECFHLKHLILNHLKSTFALLKNVECSNNNLAVGQIFIFFIT